MKNKADKRCFSLHLQLLLFILSKSYLNSRCKVEQQYFLAKGIAKHLKMDGNIKFISFETETTENTRHLTYKVN